MSAQWKSGGQILTAHLIAGSETVVVERPGDLDLEGADAARAMFRGLEAQATKIEDLEAQLRRAHIATHDLLVADLDRHKVRLVVKVPSAAQTTPDEWVDTTFLETFDVPTEAHPSS